MNPQSKRSPTAIRTQAVAAYVALAVLPLPLLGACSIGDPTSSLSATGSPTLPSAVERSPVDTGARVLPGEEWLVYQTGGPESDLRLVRPDGTDDHFLVRDRLPGDEAHPTWSPDGQRVAFDVAVDESNGQTRGSLWVVDADGSKAHELASCTLPCLQLAYPSWSPDGSTIALSRYDTRRDQSWGPSAVELLDVATGDRRVVWETADGTSSIAEVDWSPDGRSLVTTMETYPDESQGSVSSRSVAVLRADGSASTPIIVSESNEFAGEADWGPTNMIAYTSTPTGDRLQATELVITNDEGTSRNRLAMEAADDLIVFEPEWSADGTHLRVSTDDGTIARMGLATVGVDGSGLREEPWRLRTSPGGPWATHVHARPLPQTAGSTQ